MAAADKPDHAGHRARLRQRFLDAGPASLADYELLEMILFGANPRGDTKPLAKALLARFNDFNGVITADPDRLREVSGVGDTVIATLKGVHAASLRLLRGQVLNRPAISSWDALLDYCQASMGYATVEEFRVLFLDRKNQLIADEVQQRGTVDHAPVYPREVVKRALDLSATAVILVHNHPSGDPTPSRADVEMTNQVVAAAKALGITVHDHLVIGRERHASFKSLGLLLSQFALNADALRGIGFMLLGCTLFPILNACAKVLGYDYPIIEVVWARYAGHLAVILIAFMPKRGWRLFVARRPGIQGLRSVLLFCSTALYFTALHYLPMATAASISFTSPFIVMALSVPLLGERVGPHRVAAAVIGFIGALIIIRPGLEGTHWATLLVVGSASSFALYSVLTRKMSGVDSSDTMIAYTALVGVVVATIAMPFIDWEWPHNWLDVAMFAAMGVCGGTGHYFVIKAFSYAQASMIAPFNYVQLVGATILGYWIFDNFPDHWTWIGAGLIVCGGVYMAYREGVRRQAT